MKKVGALDADGVLIDYHQGYAMGWKKAFGEDLQVKDPQGYHPQDYWDVPQLSPQDLTYFQTFGLDDETWSSMPAIPGSIEACQRLADLGFELICVTALKQAHEKARFKNLLDLGFPIQKVIATSKEHASPKAAVINSIQPSFFVDDYLPYFKGVHPFIWRSLIEGRTTNNPNTNALLEPPYSRHTSLLDFSIWLEKRL